MCSTTTINNIQDNLYKKHIFTAPIDGWYSIGDGPTPDLIHLKAGEILVLENFTTIRRVY